MGGALCRGNISKARFWLFEWDPGKGMSGNVHECWKRAVPSCRMLLRAQYSKVKCYGLGSEEPFLILLSWSGVSLMPGHTEDVSDAGGRTPSTEQAACRWEDGISRWDAPGPSKALECVPCFPVLSAMVTCA